MRVGVHITLIEWSQSGPVRLVLVAVILRKMLCCNTIHKTVKWTLCKGVARRNLLYTAGGALQRCAALWRTAAVAAELLQDRGQFRRRRIG